MKMISLLLKKSLQSLVTVLLFLEISRPSIAVPVVRLSETEIQQQLNRLPGWTRENEQLQRTFVFKNFVEAIAFVDQLVEPSEQLAHHPDLLIRYNQVTITLSTHDAGGLTQKDFELARIITQIAATDRKLKIK